MWTKHIFITLICARIKGEVSREYNLFKLPLPPNPSRFSTEHSEAVLLLQLFIVCASMVL